MKRRNAETPQRRNGATPGLTKEDLVQALIAETGQAGSSSSRRLRPNEAAGFHGLEVLVCAAGCVGLMVAGFPPIDLWPLTFLVPVPLALLALRARTTSAALFATLGTQMLMWLWLLRWIIPVTPIGFALLALYQSLHFVLLVWLLRRVATSPRFAHWPMAILLPVIWTASEFFRGEIAFNGYPWYLLAHPMIEWSSFVQSSDLFGAYFISFVTAVPAGLALDIVARVTPGLTKEGPDRARYAERGRSWPSVIGPGVFAVLLLAANVGYGQWRVHQGQTLSRGPRILAIQTNLPQDNKIGWTEQQQAIDVPEFIDLTRRAFRAVGGRANVDLIVWPETMVPSLGFDSQTVAEVMHFNEVVGGGFEKWTRWVDAVEALRRELEVPMLVGSEAWVNARVAIDSATRPPMVTLDREKEYNSVFMLQGSQPYQRYDKAVLTPFGETMPYISNWKWLERQLLALGARGMRFSLDANSDVTVLTLRLEHRPLGEVTGVFVLGTPICFEDTVSWLCRRMAYDAGRKRADVLVNLSNDGWFGVFDADRKLHAQIARFRCIENRLPMVRCVNTGVSVQIDSSGRLVAAAGEGPYGSVRQPGWMLAEVQVDARRTLFGRIGNLFPGLCALMSLGLLAVTFVRPKPGSL